MKHIKLFLFILIFNSSSYAITFTLDRSSFFRLNGQFAITDLNGFTSEFATGHAGLLINGEGNPDNNVDAYFAPPPDFNSATLSIKASGVKLPNAQGETNFGITESPVLNIDSIFLGLGSGPGFDLTILPDLDADFFDEGDGIREPFFLSLNNSRIVDFHEVGSISIGNMEFIIAIQQVGQISQRDGTLRLSAGIFDPFTRNKEFDLFLDYEFGRDITDTVPEPMTASLLGLGVIGGLFRKKKISA